MTRWCNCCGLKYLTLHGLVSNKVHYNKIQQLPNLPKLHLQMPFPTARGRQITYWNSCSQLSSYLVQLKYNYCVGIMSIILLRDEKYGFVSNQNKYVTRTRTRYSLSMNRYTNTWMFHKVTWKHCTLCFART